MCGHLGQTNWKEFYSIKGKYQWTTIKYLWVNAKFDYDNPGSEPIYSLESRDVYLGYYGTWYYDLDISPTEVVDSEVVSTYYKTDSEFTNFLYVNSYQVVKMTILLQKEFERYTLYSPGNFLSSNPNIGQLIVCLGTNSSTIIQMFLILCLFSQIGGLYSFMQIIFSKLIESFNRRMFLLETINILRFLKNNSENAHLDYDPKEFDLKRSITGKVKPVQNSDFKAKSIKSSDKVKIDFNHLVFWRSGE